MSNKTPTALRITKVRRTRKSIFIAYKNGDEEHDLTSRDNPLPAFVQALDALSPLVLEVCHLPDTYSENLTTSGFTLTDKGLVTLQAKKSLPDASGPLNIATPLRFLDHPAEEGTYTPALSEAQVGLIDECVEQAKAYVKGERAQGQIKFEEDKVEPEVEHHEAGGNSEPLKFAPDTGSTGKPAKKRKGK